MAALIHPPAIRVLPSQLADQIAAGEVIERPASVLKELLENALDAAANRIDIELLQGGMRLIRVADNGHGIRADELPLAVSRHATSKIRQLDDLLRLTSLGFRGEALASICSVSRWELCSRTADAVHGYRLSSSHANQAQPINQAQGTAVSIQELFFNTPARRKFLRAETTEWRHCDDVIKRIALSRFDIGFYVKHNQRQVWRLPALNEPMQRQRRIGEVLGEVFLQHSLVLDFQWQSMRLWGWLARPEYSRQQSDLQYFYLNGRIIRDRIINHAIRQAYQDRLLPGRQPAYALFLELSSQDVDVNVHPTKHEVRFQQTRIVHDFITRCLHDALQQASQSRDGSKPFTPSAFTDTPYVADGFHHSRIPGQVEASANAAKFSPNAGLGLIEHGCVIGKRYLWQEQAQQIVITDLLCLRSELLRRQCAADPQVPMLSLPVLIPEAVNLTAAQAQHFDTAQAILREYGFDITRTGPQSVLLRAVPSRLPVYRLSSWLVDLLDKGVLSRAELLEHLLHYTGQTPLQLSAEMIRQWQTEMQALQGLQAKCSWRASYESFSAWVNALPITTPS